MTEKGNFQTHPEVEKLRREREPWREVQRKHEVVAIGDLHGRWEAFIGNAVAAKILEAHVYVTEKNGIIEERQEIRWTGGDKHVVFLGDILGDRFLDGERILDALHKLHNEAQKQGGNITVLAGNHDHAALHYLFDDQTRPQFNPFSLTHRGQGIGIFSCLQILGERIPDKKALRDLIKNEEKAEEMAHTLRNSELKKRLRTAIAQNQDLQRLYTQFAVVTRIDDTLFFHCNPTTNMLEHFLSIVRKYQSVDDAIGEINMQYISSVQACLQNPQEHLSQECLNIANIYLHTNNRENTDNESLVQALSFWDIRAIIHGHSEENEQQMSHAYPPPPIIMVSADRQTFLGNKPAKERDRSIVNIPPTGEILVGPTGIPYRK